MRTRTHRAWPAACLIAAVSAGCSGTASPAPGPSTLDASSDESAAVLAAQSGLRTFLDRIPGARRAGYGFASREEIDRAQLGTPYRVWTVDLPGGSPRPVREWRFPVTVDGQSRALLTVGEAGKGLKAVDLGAAGLARELSLHEEARAVPAQARRVLLRVYPLRADFVAFPPQSMQIEDAVFEALASARALPRSPAGAVGLSRLRPWLAERFDAARPR